MFTEPHSKVHTLIETIISHIAGTFISFTFYRYPSVRTTAPFSDFSEPETVKAK